MNKRNKLSTIAHLITLGGLALVLAVAANGTRALADDHPIPVAASGLIYGESLRTSLANISDHPMGVVAATLDATGVVVKTASLVVPAGQIVTFNISRTEAGGDEQTKQLRTQVTVQGDPNNLVVANQVIEESTGKPIAPAPVAKLAANHNETLVRDATPTTSAGN